jgi:hypothetical protein
MVQPVQYRLGHDLSARAQGDADAAAAAPAHPLADRVRLALTSARAGGPDAIALFRARSVPRLRERIGVSAYRRIGVGGTGTHERRESAAEDERPLEKKNADTPIRRHANTFLGGAGPHHR